MRGWYCVQQSAPARARSGLSLFCPLQKSHSTCVQDRQCGSQSSSAAKPADGRRPQGFPGQYYKRLQQALLLPVLLSVVALPLPISRCPSVCTRYPSRRSLWTCTINDYLWVQSGQPRFASEDELIADDAHHFEEQEEPYEDDEHQAQQPPPEPTAADSQNEPAPLCKCGIGAARLVSQTEKNPNRVFYKCSNTEARFLGLCLLLQLSWFTFRQLLTCLVREVSANLCRGGAPLPVFICIALPSQAALTILLFEQYC